MKIKNLLVLIAVLAVLVALVWVLQPSSSSTKSVSAQNLGALTLSENDYDFGTIPMSGGKVTKTIQVINNTGGSVFVKSLSTSCMCTVAYLISLDGKKKGPFGMPGHGGPSMPANELIENGESRTLEVVFDPNAHGPAGVGTISRGVFLEDGSGNTTQFKFKGVVIP